MGKLAVYRLAYFLSIVFTLLACYCSIYSTSCGMVDPNINLTPSYICLLRPIIIAVNLILLIYWILRFRVWFILPIIALAWNYRFINSYFSFYNKSDGNYKKNLSVLTYNVHSFDDELTGFSAKEFAQLMNDKGIDVICFQEYSGNADFTNEMIYKTYHNFYPYSYLPHERDLAIYSKYPITNHKAYSFANSNNGAVWADINVDGKTLRVFNVHMQTTSLNSFKHNFSKIKNLGFDQIKDNLYSYYMNNMSDNIKERAKQSNYIHSIMDTTKNEIILCGDLNDIPDSYTYNRIKGDLADGFTKSGKGFASTYKGLYNLFRIDYIFLSKSLNSLEYKIMDYEMSDHKPVYIKVGL